MGSTVTWTVATHDGRHEWVDQLLGSSWGDKVRYSEGHHDDEKTTISGVVRTIHEVRCRRELQADGAGQVSIPVRDQVG